MITNENVQDKTISEMNEKSRKQPEHLKNMAPRSCRFCLKEILDKKNYRCLSKTELKTALKSLNVSSDGIVCISCFNKLNKLARADEEIKRKLESMRAEKEKLFQELKSLPGLLCGSSSETTQMDPTSSKAASPRGMKRPLIRTPSPKSGLKRSLFISPKNGEESQLKMVAEKFTQTKKLEEDFLVKVVIKYAGMERSKVITDKDEQNIIKAIYNQKTGRILKYFKSSDLKRTLLKKMCTEIRKYIKSLLQSKEPLFRNQQDLTVFEWEKVAAGFQMKAPSLYETLQTIVGIKGTNQKVPQLITAAGVLLYARNKKFSTIQYILGLVLDQCGLSKEGMKLIHDLGVSVSPTSIHRKKRQLIKNQEDKLDNTIKKYVKQLENPTQTQEETVKPIEILGDNFDVTVTPARMTQHRQRKSLHWFLTMVKQKRVTIEDLHIPVEDLPPSQNILTMPTSSWIPSDAQMDLLFDNVTFHVARILLKYIDFLKPVKLMEYIGHEYLDKTKERSVVLNCDLIDASENSSEGMIKILQKIHKLAVPHRADGQNQVIRKVVFGGDVLTNERAFSAQEAMQNNLSDFDCLQGLIHRPEGLHREMNFLMVVKAVIFGCWRI